MTADATVISAIENQGWSATALLGGGARERILAIYNTAQSAQYGWLYTNSPAVRTVIDLIVRNVGQLDLRLYEEVTDAERQPRPDHPAALSMRYPNDEVPADGFVRSIFKDYLIHDNAYALVAPGENDQVTLLRIPSYMVEVQGASLFRTENFRVWPMGAWTAAGTWGGAGTYIDFPPDQVMHWHGESPRDPRVGLSHLDTLRGVIAEDAALAQATVELANSGLQEPSWIFRPAEAPPWSNEARIGFEEDLTARMRRRHSKPVVMEEGMEIRSFGITPRDAQMLEIRKWCLSQVATEYGVPLGLLALDPAADVPAAQSEFYTDVLPPYCENFTRFLNQRLLVKVYDWTDGYFEFNLDEKLMGDARLAALVSASGRAVMLTNEARAKINLPPVDGGDELVTPLNVIVGDNPKPSPQLMGPQAPGQPSQDGSYRVGDYGPMTPPAAAAAGIGNRGPNATAEPAKSINAGPAVTSWSPDAVTSSGFPILPQLHPAYGVELERQMRAIDTMKSVIQGHYNRLGRSLRQKAGVADWDRWDREFSDDLDRGLKSIVAKEGELYAFKLGGGDFDMRRVENYLGAMAAGAADAINDTIRGEIEQLGLDTALAHAPQHVASAGASLGARATMWAREEAARQSPGVEGRLKTWIADSDRHAEFNGQTVPIGDDWPSGFAPGSAPGCKCTMTIT